MLSVPNGVVPASMLTKSSPQMQARHEIRFGILPAFVRSVSDFAFLSWTLLGILRRQTRDDHEHPGENDIVMVSSMNEHLGEAGIDGESRHFSTNVRQVLVVVESA